MSRIVKIILAVNLIVLAILVFVYPHLMVGPGKLIPGHKQLESRLLCLSHAPSPVPTPNAASPATNRTISVA